MNRIGCQLKWAVLLSLTILTVACAEPEQAAGPATANAADNSPPSVNEKLMFRFSNFTVSQDDYIDTQTWENPEADFVAQQLANAAWDDPDLRPKFVLSRVNENGKVDIICVKRNESEPGERMIELNVVVDGEAFEAETTQIESTEVFNQVVQAFLSSDPNIKELVDWDTIVE